MATTKRIADADSSDAGPEARKGRSRRAPTSHRSKNASQRRIPGTRETSHAPTKPRSKSNARKGKRSIRSRPDAGVSDAPDEAFRAGSKAAAVVGLLSRDLGATLAELIEATGWQAHSVRGFLSGSLKKKKAGLAIESEKSNDGQRRYRIVS